MLGRLLSAIFTVGGITTVGSTASLGWSLRMTTAGGVNCSCATLGSGALGVSSLSRSPPPPPPESSSGFSTG